VLTVPMAIFVPLGAVSKRIWGFRGRKCWVYSGVRWPSGVFSLIVLRNFDQAKSTWRMRGCVVGSGEGFGGVAVVVVVSGEDIL
jgi:hypothetical protein